MLKVFKAILFGMMSETIGFDVPKTYKSQKKKLLKGEESQTLKLLFFSYVKIDVLLILETVAGQNM